MNFEIGKTDGGFVFRDLHAPVGRGNLDRSHQRIRKHVNDSPFIPKHPNTNNNVFQPVDSNSNSQKKLKKSVRKNIYPNLVNPPHKKKGKNKKIEKYATKNCLILGFSYVK